MSRNEAIAAASQRRADELDEVKRQHKAGNVPDFVKATDEVFKRYHQSIWDAEKISENKFDSKVDRCDTV